MEHAKKLMLVDSKSFRPSMREKTLSNLDVEIEQTLNSEISDQEKAYKYIEALRKYKYYDVQTADKNIDEKSKSESNILDVVSSEQRHKAKRILDHLKRDANFQINNQGEIIYKQQTLNRSHIGDLLNEALKKKSILADSPIGWRQFLNSLKELAVPKDLIENVNYWNYMHPPIDIKKKLKAKIAASPLFTTPSAKRESLRGKVKPPSKKWLEYDK
jgi:hypothetical protein